MIRNNEDIYEKRLKKEINLKKQLVLDELNNLMKLLPPEKHDKPFLIAGPKSYTPRQMIKEVENDTEIGNLISRSFDKGRLELLKRKR
ncbi:MAG: hypothetical protein ACFFBZ_15680 [Promethearchaeota archaeon]